MNTKKRNVFFDLFYKKYKSIDKMNYIKNVMDSCETKVQLDSAFSWGTKVIWKNCSTMREILYNEYGSSFAFPIEDKIMDMCKEISDEITNHYNNILKRIDIKE